MNSIWEMQAFYQAKYLSGGWSLVAGRWNIDRRQMMARHRYIASSWKMTSGQ
jgi:hypothetical protein